MKRIVLQTFILLIVSCAAGLLVNRVSGTRVQLFRRYVPAGKYQISVAVASPLLNFHREGQRIVFLDVRPPEVFRAGCIPGAVNVPDQAVNPELLEKVLRAPGRLISVETR